MRNRIFGALGVLWGGAVLIYALTKDEAPRGTNAAAAGNTAGTVFGGLLFVVGLYYLIKGGSASKKE
jgi:hypothetical protein